MPKKKAREKQIGTIGHPIRGGKFKVTRAEYERMGKPRPKRAGSYFTQAKGWIYRLNNRRKKKGKVEDRKEK